MVTTEQARQKYDQIADRYEEIFFYVADVGRTLVRFAAPPAGARVLDIGAGRGAVARAALDRGCSVTAIDASPRMMEKLATDYPAITALTMDAAHLGFPDHSFDLVTAGFVVQILDEPAAVLTEARRVLKPGGTVALSLETQAVGRLGWLQELSVEFFSAIPAGEAPVPAEDQPAPPGPMNREHLDTLLSEAGFVSPVTESVEMPLPVAGPEALWDWLVPRGLTEAVQLLPADRAEEFHQRFLAGAGRMHDDGGIVLDFAATLHRGKSPA
ncbi:class I SAM-dependent methyltransferase [Amycolatopsis sp.]|uniref:class I SAM-dependent methyltransferase n=1 Tax=Amycolatopsis sp. TaxID=37632 RepID=UPI002DF7B537|nr:methyltransferase domain-containing protein [Amycolatopsis sp.]